MTDTRLQLLRDLTGASGVSGYEDEVRTVLRNHLKGLADVEQDNLGSLLFKKKGTSERPRIMIPGHMDEIGFMVRSVSDKGFVHFLPVGGWFDQVMLAQRVRIKTGKGDVIGVIGSKPPHLMSEEERKKVVEKKDMYIDVGASSRKEAEDKFGIRPGDPVVPISELTRLSNPDLVMAKAWDDRVGCALFTDVIKRLRNMKHPNTVYGAGTVQEEVGLRGAVTSAEVVDPDVAIVAECGIASDVPGIKPEEQVGSLGGGPQITVMDAGMIPNLKLRDLVIGIAKKKRIPFQYSAVTGGKTDGSPIHLHSRGVACIYLGVPVRYIHSHSGIMSLKDYEHTLNLMVETIKALDGKRVKSLIP